MESQAFLAALQLGNSLFPSGAFAWRIGEGDKIISVNKEDQHLVVKGWVRPDDIDAQNQVLSTRLADAKVDYYGVGTVGIKQRPGFGYWLMDLVWPF